MFELEYASLLAAGNETDQTDFRELLVGFGDMAAGQNTPAPLNGDEDTGSQDLARLPVPNDKADGKVRDVRQNGIRDIVRHSSRRHIFAATR